MRSYLEGGQIGWWNPSTWGQTLVDPHRSISRSVTTGPTESLRLFSLLLYIYSAGEVIMMLTTPSRSAYLWFETYPSTKT